MSSPKHYPTFRVSQTTQLARSLGVFDPEAVTNVEYGIILCRGYGRIDQSAATATYFIQFLQGPTLPANGIVTNFVSPITLVHTNGVHSTFDFDFGPDYLKCRNGLFIVVSTTEYLKTIVTSDMLTCSVFWH